MSLLIYIIKTIFVSGGMLSYYWLCLRNKTFHGFNRFCLLSIPLLSLLIPALHINPPSLWSHTGDGSAIRLLGVARGTLEEAVTVYATHKQGLVFTWESVALMISSGFSLLMAIRLIRSIRFIRSLRKHSPILPLPQASVYFVSEKGTPFSFFKSIFWGKDMEMNSPEGKQILRHELFHVVQQHSLDIMLMETCTVLMWWNPFLYLIRTELKVIHEYAADAHATTDADGYAYAKLLLTHISGASVTLVHPFFKNQIKRRITMITTNNKNKKNRLARCMILPVLLIFICLFSFKIPPHAALPLSPMLRVVIDPGHGGKFNGTSYKGIYEKNINLSIARKIQALSRDYRIEVILTREKDEDLAGTNLEASLNYRAGLAATKNADLFISIHVNAGREPGPQDKYSGFEMYVPGNSNKFHEGSVKLASSITGFIKTDYTIAPELKERDENIRILARATVPAILIECGYIDNTTDLAWLQDEKNQEKIARDILEGIQQYGTNVTYLDSMPHDNTVVNKNNVLTANAAAEQNLQVNQSEKAEQSEHSQQAEQIEQDNDLQQNLRPDSSAPFRKVEVEAEYPGGAQAWIKYLTKTLKYPDEAASNEVQGSVIIEFVVNEDGSLTDIHAISGPSQLRKESIRVITESGKWVPAKDHGVIVASYHKQPINFKLETK